MKKKMALLYVDSASHLLVDALCLAALAQVTGGSRVYAVLLYNTLAFSTQCLVGLLTDLYPVERYAAPAAMLAVAAGYMLPVSDLLMVCIVGLGNSVFHVAAGTRTLKGSGHKAADLGTFVAPGALGVTLGSLMPEVGPVLAAGLVLLAPVSYLLSADELRQVGGIGQNRGIPIRPVVLLTAAVAVRALGGMEVSYPWKTGYVMTMIMTLAVVLGKLLGGYVCDLIGARMAAYITIPASAVLIVCFSAWPVPAIAGQLLLNLTMPLTLYLLYRLMPDEPGLAFGLAASALWPGTIAGGLIKLTGPAQGLLTGASFIFGLYAVICSIRYLDNKEDNT